MPIGQRLPLHVGAGKVIAAAMPEHELDQLMEPLGEMRLATSAPMVGPDGEVKAAVSVVGLSNRMSEEKVQQLTTEVRRAAQAIAERYRSPY